MGRRVLTAAALVAACALAVVLGALAVEAVRGDGTTPRPPEGGLEAATRLTPPVHLFGDRVVAETTVRLDRRGVDPASVRVRTAMPPYSPVGGTTVSRSRSGDAVELVYRVELVCLVRECRPPKATGRKTFAFDPVDVRYRMLDGDVRTTTVEWPPLEARTRLRAIDYDDPRWRIPAETPPPMEYAVSPALVAVGGYAAAALLLALGVALVGPIVVALFRSRERRETELLASLAPLERAVYLLRSALAGGDWAEARKALDRLARELRRRGRHDLAERAAHVAWSAGTFDADAAQSIAAAAGSAA